MLWNASFWMWHASYTQLHRTVREEGRIHEAPSFPEVADDVVDAYLKREEMFSSVV